MKNVVFKVCRFSVKSIFCFFMLNCNHESFLVVSIMRNVGTGRKLTVTE